MNYEGLTLATIITLAFILRTTTIGNQSLWFDEAFSILLARHDFGEIVARTARDTMPPLYYWLLHPLTVLGPVDMLPRLLSAVAGTISVVLVYTIARRLFSMQVALWAALFTAVAPFQVFYGQEARMYAVLGLWGLLAAYGFLRGWLDGDRRGWVLYSAATALAQYTHPLGGLPSVALLAAAALTTLRAQWSRKAWSSLRSAPLALIVAGIAYLPWATILIGQTQRIVESFWAAPPSPISPLASLYLFFEGPFGGALFPVLLTAVLVPLAFTLPAVWRSTLSHEADPARISPLPPGGVELERVGLSDSPTLLTQKQSLTFLWAWLLLPLFALLALSLVRSVYLERVVIGASFPLYILLGWAAIHVRPRRLATGIGIAVLLAAGIGLAGWFTNPALGKPPQRDAAALVAHAWREGMPVLHTSDGSYLPFLLYAPQVDNRLLDGDPEQLAHTARARSTYDTLGVRTVTVDEAVRGASEFILVVAADHSVDWQREQADAIDAVYIRLSETDIGGIIVRRYGGRR